MTTKREQIVAAAVTLLGTIPELAGKVWRDRETPFQREESPAVAIFWERDDVKQSVIDFIDHDLSLVISVYARGDAPDAVADPIVEKIHEALMGQTFGGLALDVNMDMQDLELAEADLTACFVNMRYTVWYRHSRNSMAG